MIPGEHHANPNPSCNIAVNTKKCSDYQMNKTVSFDAFGISTAIKYDATVLIPEDQPRVQIESPTGYMSRYFDNFYLFVPKNESIIGPVDTKTTGTAYPLIFANSDKSAAMGAIHSVQPENGML